MISLKDNLIVLDLSQTEASLLLNIEKSTNCISSGFCSDKYEDRLTEILDIFQLKGATRTEVYNDMDQYIKARASGKKYKRRFHFCIDEENDTMTIIDVQTA